MTTLDLTVTPSRADTDADGIDHLVCLRRPARAFCGLEVADAPWVDEIRPVAMCVVCDDLDNGTCPHTGRPCNC